ncbi:hypothetical protein EON68_00520, partial [archaeon]
MGADLWETGSITDVQQQHLKDLLLAGDMKTERAIDDVSHGQHAPLQSLVTSGYLDTSTDVKPARTGAAAAPPAAPQVSTPVAKAPGSTHAVTSVGGVASNMDSSFASTSPASLFSPGAGSASGGLPSEGSGAGAQPPVGSSGGPIEQPMSSVLAQSLLSTFTQSASGSGDAPPLTAAVGVPQTGGGSEHDMSRRPRLSSVGLSSAQSRMTAAASRRSMGLPANFEQALNASHPTGGAVGGMPPSVGVGDMDEEGIGLGLYMAPTMGGAPGLGMPPTSAALHHMLSPQDMATANMHVHMRARAGSTLSTGAPSFASGSASPWMGGVGFGGRPSGMPSPAPAGMASAGAGMPSAQAGMGSYPLKRPRTLSSGLMGIPHFPNDSFDLTAHGGDLLGMGSFDMSSSLMLTNSMQAAQHYQQQQHLHQQKQQQQQQQQHMHQQHMHQQQMHMQMHGGMMPMGMMQMPMMHMGIPLTMYPHGMMEDPGMQPAHRAHALSIDFGASAGMMQAMNPMSARSMMGGGPPSARSAGGMDMHPTMESGDAGIGGSAGTTVVSGTRDRTLSEYEAAMHARPASRGSYVSVVDAGDIFGRDAGVRLAGGESSGAQSAATDDDSDGEEYAFGHAPHEVAGLPYPTNRSSTGSGHALGGARPHTGSPMTSMVLGRAGPGHDFGLPSSTFSNADAYEHNGGAGGGGGSAGAVRASTRLRTKGTRPT